MMDIGFFIKKLVAAFCMPLPVIVLLLCLAGLFYWRKRFVLAKGTVLFSILLFYAISIQVTGDFFASTLEQQYSSYQQKHNGNVDYVLVLGSGHASDKTKPISTLLSSSGLKRLFEGVRIYRLNPGSKLLLSGYRGDDDITHAQALKKVALYFGVPESDMILAGSVKDTKEEANHWTKVASGKRLVLVTSASHMPRSMHLFQEAKKAQGLSLRIIPAPTDFISHKNSSLTWKSWFPAGHNIQRIERIWHEYLGLLWAHIAA